MPDTEGTSVNTQDTGGGAVVWCSCGVRLVFVAHCGELYLASSAVFSCVCRDIGGVSVHRAVEYGSEACGMRDVGVCATRGK